MALIEAQKHDAELTRKAELAKLAHDLALNRLFKKDGRVMGIKRITRKREGRRDADVLIIRAQGKSAEISIDCRTFTEGYKLAINKLVELHGVELTTELTVMFNKAKAGVLNESNSIL